MIFSQCVREIRTERGKTQREFAVVVGLKFGTYGSLERYPVNYNSHSIKTIMQSSIYTKEEKSRLQEAYDAKKEKEPKQYFPNSRKNYTTRDKRTFKIHLCNRRIGDVPDFYEKLNALGDLQEIEDDDAGLMSLRRELGVVK